jgi:hypothetical protein
MYGLLFQDWITVQGDTSIHDVIQSASDWRSLEQFQDVAFWLEVTTNVSTGAITMLYETAPTRDEKVFKQMVASVAMTPGASPIVTKVLFSAGTPTFPPMAKWVRWHINSTSTTPWTVTFRISAAVNAAMGTP